MNIYLDIETIPTQPEEETKARLAEDIKAPGQMKDPVTIAKWHDGVGKYEGDKEKAIEKAYRATALDGTYGHLLSFTIMNDKEYIVSNIGLAMDERATLENFKRAVWALIDDSNGRPPFFIGHNIEFDLKFLFRRAVILGVDLGFALPFAGRHGKDYFDNMIAWCGTKERISQDKLAKALGFKGKPDGIDGSKVWDAYKAGEIDIIEEYNISDVKQCRDIYRKINFRCNDEN